MSIPESGEKVIGKTPAWMLWAQEEIRKAERSKALIAMGCFTVNDFKKLAPADWTRDKCAKFLDASGLENELAPDHREYNGRPVRFYFPPKDGSSVMMPTKRSRRPSR